MSEQPSELARFVGNSAITAGACNAVVIVQLPDGQLGWHHTGSRYEAIGALAAVQQLIIATIVAGATK
jgi:uncharacterized membrane protein YgdD (TMEM256/DUF423 family)